MQKCKKEWKRPIEELIRKFPSIYQFRNGELNKFILLLRKEKKKKFDKSTILSKEAFCSESNLENITDKVYAHAQKVWKYLVCSK